MKKPEPLRTKFTEMFDVEYPVVCAPMFLVSDEGMTVAACEAGGVGSFPALNFRPISAYRKAIQDIKAKTAKPFGINIIVQKSNKYRDEHIDIAVEEEVPLIITSLGNPRETIKRAHQGKTKVFCDVVNLKHAKKVADLGADGLIAVGSGAGGHAGDISQFALIPYLKKHLNLPVIAAGSIVDGRGMLAAMSLGADGVYMGTRFIASDEAPVSEEYKRAIVNAGCEDIVNTDRVDGFPGNFILTESLERHGVKPGFVETVLTQSKTLKRGLSLMRVAKILFKSPEDKKVSYKSIFSAGHGSGLIDSIKPIESIVYETVDSYRELRDRMP